MDKFRAWRDGLKKAAEGKSNAAGAGKPSQPPSAGLSPARPQQDQPHKRLHASDSDAAGPATASSMSFAEMDRLRRDRHAIFTQLLDDADSFAAFLRFLPAASQHELLFVCEINQLLNRATEWEEVEVYTQAIKIANIFLRTSEATQPGGPPTNSPNPKESSVLQVPSLQPATRRHLQSCIPLTMPAHLLSPGAQPSPPVPPAPAPSSSPPGGSPHSAEAYQPKFDTKVILTMLEVARDQVEESLSKRYLQKFLELLNQSDAHSLIKGVTISNDDLGALQFEYTFDDVVVAVTAPQGEAFAYVYRAFLLYLMEEKRHRILCFWAEVARGLAALQEDATYQLLTSGATPGGLHPSQSEQDFSSSSSLTRRLSNSSSAAPVGSLPSSTGLGLGASLPGTSSLGSTPEPSSAPTSEPSPPPWKGGGAAAGGALASFLSSKSLSQLVALHEQLEDALRRFYPDLPIKTPWISTGNGEQPGESSSGASTDKFEGDDESFLSELAGASEEDDLASPNSPAPLDVGVLLAQLDAAPREDELTALKHGIWDLSTRLRAMQAKMEKLLRYSFWPQFCKSETYHSLSRIRRPPPVVPPSGSSRSRRGSKDASAMAPSPSPSPGLSAATALAAASPSPSAGASAAASVTSTTAPSTPATPAPPAAKPRASHLLASLKSHRATREMLLLECGGDGGGTNGPPEPERLLDYVCVLRCSPVLPPRPAAATIRKTSSSSSSAAAVTSVSSHVWAPALPPRAPTRSASGDNLAASKLQGGGSTKGSPALAPSPSPPHLPGESPLPSTGATPSAVATAFPAPITRGTHCLSWVLRYPVQDHTHCPLPPQIMDLAFPLVAEGTDTCPCTQATASATTPGAPQPPAIALIKESVEPLQLHASAGTPRSGTPEPAAVASVNSASTPTPSTTAPSAASTSPLIVPALSDFHFSPGLVLRSPHAPVLGAGSQLSGVRLFNLVCTSSAGERVHCAVLSFQCSELVDERWVAEEDLSATSSEGMLGIGALVARSSGERKKSSLNVLADASLVSGPSRNLPAPSVALQQAAPSSAPAPPQLPPMSPAKGAGANSSGGAPPSLPTSPKTASTPTARAQAKLSSLFDGIVKDVQKFVENEFSVQAQQRQQQAAAQSTASRPAAGSGDYSSQSNEPPSATAATAATDEAAAVSSAAADLPVALPVRSASAGSEKEAAATVAATAASSSEASKPAVNATASALPAVPAAPVVPAAPRLMQHQRVFRATVSYSLVLLTRHSLFERLRELLAALLPPGAQGADAVAQLGLPDGERTTLRLFLAQHVSRSSSGALFDLLDRPAFFRCLLATRVPRTPLDLWGLHRFAAHPAYLTAPPRDFQLELLFRALRAERVLLVLECLLAERKVLLLSVSASMLTLAGECLQALLYPFRWRYLYIPLLPPSLFKYLACPTPFLIGVHGCHSRRAREHVERADTVWVDLDHDEVYVPGGMTSAAAGGVTLPPQIREGFVRVAERVYGTPRDKSSSGAEGQKDSTVAEEAPASPVRSSDAAAVAEGDADSATPKHLSPDKPVLDVEARKMMDPYAGAEVAPSSATAADATQGKDDAPTSTPGPGTGGANVLSPPSKSATLAATGSKRVDASGQALDSHSSSSGAAESEAHAKSLLLQLELTKIFAHLLKSYRSFCVGLDAGATVASSGGAASTHPSSLLLFDAPAFLATKPAHYQACLQSLLNSSYFPAFLRERTAARGLAPVHQDAFDRYEAALSGARVEHLWLWSAGWRRPSVRRLIRRQIGSHLAAELGAWIRDFHASGVDPSLHHARFLPAWNGRMHASSAVEPPQLSSLSASTWIGGGTASSADRSAVFSVRDSAPMPPKVHAPTPAAAGGGLGLGGAGGSGIRLAQNLLLLAQRDGSTTPTSGSAPHTPTVASAGEAQSDKADASVVSAPLSSVVASTTSAGGSSSPSSSPRRKSSLYRTQRPRASSRSQPNSRSGSPQRAEQPLQPGSMAAAPPPPLHTASDSTPNSAAPSAPNSPAAPLPPPFPAQLQGMAAHAAHELP